MSLEELEVVYGESKKRHIIKDNINQGSKTNLFRTFFIFSLMFTFFLLFMITNILVSNKLAIFNEIYNITSLTYYESTSSYNMLREKYVNNPIITKDFMSDEAFENVIVNGNLNDEDIYSVTIIIIVIINNNNNFK